MCACAHPYMLGQYRPYYDSVSNMQPWLRDNKPVVEGPRLGFICDDGHQTFVNLVAITLGVAGEYPCTVCSRPGMEAYARMWVEAKLNVKLQLCTTHAGAVYTCMRGDKPLKVAIGDQLEPVPHPRILLPDTANERRLEEALKRFNDELATVDQA